jgi:hypothetical protein
MKSYFVRAMGIFLSFRVSRSGLFYDLPLGDSCPPVPRVCGAPHSPRQKSSGVGLPPKVSREKTKASRRSHSRKTPWPSPGAEVTRTITHYMAHPKSAVSFYQMHFPQSQIHRLFCDPRQRSGVWAYPCSLASIRCKAFEYLYPPPAGRGTRRTSWYAAVTCLVESAIAVSRSENSTGRGMRVTQQMMFDGESGTILSLDPAGADRIFSSGRNHS